METTNSTGPAWLSTWQAICDQEAQAKLRYKKFMEEWYRIETKMKLMDLRVDAMLKMRDEYLTHLFQKYPNWKPNFTSYGLRSSTTTNAQAPDYQSDLYRLMETEMIRSLRQRDNAFQMQQPTFSQAMANLNQGNLNHAMTPAYFYNQQHQMRPTTPAGFPGPSSDQYNPYAMSPYMGSGQMNAQGGAPDPATTAQMTELKTEMSQIKSRLEDITVYLRELRHSAIELTTSVSRRSSMRDKERRRAPLVDQGAGGGGGGSRSMDEGTSRVGGSGGAVVERNVVRDDTNPDRFVDQVNQRLVEERRERNVRYQDEEDDDIASDRSYHQPQPAAHTPAAQREKPKPAAAAVRQAPKPAAPYKAPIAEESVSPEEPEIQQAKAPRFNFGGQQQQPKPKAASQPPPPPPPPPAVQSESESSEDSDSPPATATWLISGEKPKSAPAAVAREPAPAPKLAQPSAAAVAKPAPPKVESSPGSTPELAPRAAQPAASGYQALLGAVTNKASNRKSIGSESDDLDDAFASAVKSPIKAVAPVTPAKEPPPRPRDASLSDIFSFGKSEPAKKPMDDFLSPVKPKTAPAFAAPVAKPATAPAAVVSKPVAEATPAKKPQPAAAAPTGAPDDFLKKLFPDKFAAAAGAGKAAGGGEVRKKKPAFFMGDEDSDDDIDLPQGNQKSDLDDDFFFR